MTNKKESFSRRPQRTRGLPNRSTASSFLPAKPENKKWEGDNSSIESMMSTNNDGDYGSWWPTPLEETFMKLMIKLRNKKGETKCKYWRLMKRRMRKKCGVDFSTTELQNKDESLKKHYAEVSALLQQMGLRWEDCLASEEFWGKFLQGKPWSGSADAQFPLMMPSKQLVLNAKSPWVWLVAFPFQ
ncbi:hypothetical protein L1049_023188 [Liquidambar formosana]|uniref:Myb/SANT-like domain-containing protein n=1 Tax=Liquidambar formosana TaxID=63359 RepID=A0AAP0RDM2_LIQFO